MDSAVSRVQNQSGCLRGSYCTKKKSFIFKRSNGRKCPLASMGKPRGLAKICLWRNSNLVLGLDHGHPRRVVEGMQPSELKIDKLQL
jgi:hypothetical protein